MSPRFLIGLYSFLLQVGLLMGWPVAFCALLAIPKMRAGLLEKMGYFSSEKQTKLKRPASRACHPVLSTDSHQVSASKGFLTDPTIQQRVWIHAVSVGEVNAIVPLVQRLQADVPALDIVLSTTTQTGQAVAKKRFPQLVVFYFPLDFRPVVERVMALVAPNLLLLAETELWPNVVDVAVNRENCKVMLINGRLSERSFKGYRRFRWFFASVLRQFTAICVQTQADAERMIALGARPQKVSVCGNLKFDQVPVVSSETLESLRQVLGLDAGEPVLVAASTHTGEEVLMVETFMRLKETLPELKLILAPRHPERFTEVAGLLEKHQLPFFRRSEAAQQSSSQSPSVILLDTIGELVPVYALSTVAVVGGSFVKTGGHNVLEPLSLGVPVVVGPHMFHFAEITRLMLEAEAGVQVDVATLYEALLGLLQSVGRRQRLSKNGMALVKQYQGATTSLLQRVQGWLDT